MQGIEADGYGDATPVAELTGITLRQGPAAILGTVVIAHAGADDSTTQPT